MADLEKTKKLINALLGTALGAQAKSDDIQELIGNIIDLEEGLVNPYTVAISVIKAVFTQKVSTAGVYKNSVDTIDTSKFPDGVTKFLPLWESEAERWEERNDDTAQFFITARSGESYADTILGSIRRNTCN